MRSVWGAFWEAGERGGGCREVGGEGWREKGRRKGRSDGEKWREGERRGRRNSLTIGNFHHLKIVSAIPPVGANIIDFLFDRSSFSEMFVQKLSKIQKWEKIGSFLRILEVLEQFYTKNIQ